MNFNEIQELIRLVSKHKLSEFILRDGEFRLVIRNQSNPEPIAPVVVAPVQQPMVTLAPSAPATPVVPASAPVSQPAASEVPAASTSEDSSRYIAIKSPMVGTFYRSASPEKPPFVKVGDTVDLGQHVCIIEAMKLFNEIESDIKGKIVKVLVEDASPVEYEQALFLVDPA